MDNVNKLVDEVFDGGFAQFGKVRSAEKQIDVILDKVDLGKGTINTTGRPYDHPIKARVVPTIDVETEVDECVGPMMGGENFESSEYDSGPSKNDDPKKISNDINNVPNQNVGGLLKSIHGEISEAQIWRMIAEMRINEDYKSYFSSMLKKHGYKSPADIPADKKKGFFNAVDAGWKGKNEVSEGIKEKYQKMRCAKISKEIAELRAAGPLCKKNSGQNLKKLKRCIDDAKGGVIGLTAQKKKWNC